MNVGRTSLLGALVGLTLAENQGDVMDEVMYICDAIGIERPEYDGDAQAYRFSWQDEALRN